MSSDDLGGARLKKVLEIFEVVADQPEARRRAYIDEACAGDPEARQMVEELLAADASAETFVDQPVLPRDCDLPAAEDLGDFRQRRIGAYRLIRQIGQGGMGTVYLARRDDQTFRRQVVVKLVRHGMESEDLKRRLKIERQILANLDHPNIAKIYDGGTTEEGLPYFVMELVEGEALDTYCDRLRLTVDERLDLFSKICSAVEAAHRSLVVHRDLKPGNILVTAEGEPKLLDFGIAKLLDAELMGAEEVEITETWHRRLTPSYASPEQIRGQMITTSSDVYSLGVLLYQLLTGKLPRRFHSTSPREIDRKLTEEDPTSPSAAVVEPSAEEPAREQRARDRGSDPERLARRLHGDLDAIVLEALRESPRERYASVSHLAEDIARFREGLPVRARRGTWRYRMVKLARRNRRAVAVVLLVMALPAAFAGGMGIMLREVAYERDQVIAEREKVEAERNRAREERDRAELEKEKKEIFLGWVLDLFRKSDPFISNEEHSEVTVRQALDRSIVSLEGETRSDPELRAEILLAVGVIYRNLGLHEQAEEQLSKAWKIRQAIHGDEHPEVARAEAKLATVLREQDEEALERAHELAGQATTTLEKSLGREHPQFLEALNTQVSVLCYRGDYRAAEPLAEEAVERSRRLGVSKDQLTSALNNLATAKVNLGRYEEAADVYRQSLELRRSLHGNGSPWLVAPLINLGVALRQLEQLDAATLAYEEALAIQEEALGRDHSNLFPTLFNLARLAQARREPAEAIVRFDRTEQNLRSNSGDEHPNLFLLAVRREEARIELGESAEAERQLRALLSRWRARLGESSPRISIAESLLGRALSDQDRDTEARQWLESSLENLLLHGKHRHQREALGRLVEHLEARGLEKEANAWRARLPGEV